MPNATATYTLKFIADTNEAKKNLNDLKQAFDSAFTSNKIGDKIISPEAIKQAAELRGIIEQAKDSAGNFDLSKFTNGLKNAKIPLEQVGSILHNIGADNAFDLLSQQILSANANTRILQGTVKKFFDGLKNTAMWTIQSQAIHGVQSALSSAYRYAQQLNKGLTDIAIVSDLDTKQLTAFAKTANQMARDLSASTSDVVSGALIYYQAGLSDEEVIKRTETTIKLAQTSGESAEQISSYMTAIWNNFYDGSKSVEYYADAISYLGAVTAASNADIAEGIQAFAATANTVGLSYEYAASSLTVLRDVTQQSASTIGNSLKTIFARLSSVKQGESLEDGVDFTKYSKALLDVGVNILDVNGNLRNMDDILDNLAEKWQGLSNAQKVALAQTVGGVRQYNNLISLMDNYERFQELVSGAQNSEGYLQNQADIYADSWEGASNRVKAAFERIYDQIINDKFFITLTNFLSFIVNLIGDIIDGMGGLKGLLPFIVNAFLSINPKETALGLQNLVKEILELKNALNGVTDAQNRSAQSQMFEAWIDKAFIGNGEANPKILELADQTKKLNEAAVEARAKGQEQEAARLQIIVDRNVNILNLLQKQAKTIDETAGKYNDLEKANRYAEQAVLKGQAVDYLKNQNNTIEDKKNYLNALKADPTAFGFNKDFVKNNKNLQNIDKLTEETVNTIIKSFERSLVGTVTQMRKSAGEGPYADAEEKLYKKAVEEVNEKKKETKQHQQEITQETQKTAEALGVAREDQEVWVQLASDIQEDYKITREEAEKMSAIIIQARKENQGILRDKTPTDWSKVAVTATRAATSLWSMSSAMEGLYTSIKEGNVNIGSLIGSFGTIIFGAKQMTSILSGPLTSAWALVGVTGEAAVASWTMGLSIVAAIALPFIIKGIEKLIELFKYSDTELKIKEINKNIEDQQQQLNNLNSTYNDTISLIDELNSKKDTFAELEVGTVKWTQALHENNNAITDLLDKYDLLIKDKYYTIDSNGVMSLTKEAENEILNRLERQIDFTQLSLYAEKSNLNKANTQQKREEINNALFKNVDIRTEVSDNIIDAILNKNLKFEGNQLVGTFDVETFESTQEEAINGILELINSNEESINVLKSNTQAIENNNAMLNSRNELIGQQLTRGISNEQLGLEEWQRDPFEKLYGDEYDRLKKEVEGKYDNYDKVQLANVLESENYKELGYKYDSSDKTFYDAAGNELNPEQIRNILENADIQIALKNPEDFIKQLKEENVQIGTAEDKKAWDDAAPERQRQQDALQLQEDTRLAKELGFDEEQYQKYVAYLQEVNSELKNNQELADQVALANMRINRGVETLQKNFDDWAEEIKLATDSENDWAREGEGYMEAMTGIREALSDIANIDLTELDFDFIEDNLGLIEEAATGNEKAIDKLIKAIAIDFTKALSGNKEEIDGWEQSLVDGINAINFNEITIGAHLDDDITQPFYQALQRMILNSQIGAEQINDYLATIGYTPIVDYITVPAEHWQSVSNNFSGGEITVEDEHGEKHTLAMTQAEAESMAEAGGLVKIPIIKGSNKNGTAQFASSQNLTNALASSTFTGGTGRNVSSSNRHGGSGGSGGSEHHRTPKAKDEDRYHEINQKLKQTEHELNKVNTLKDRSYGRGRLNAMDEEIKLLEREAEQYKELYREAEHWFALDKSALVNFGASFNPDGTIANYQAWQESWIDRYNNESISEEEFSAWQKAVQKYEDSLAHLNEAEEKYIQKMNQIYDEHLEKVVYRVEYLNELIELSTDYLDYLIEKLDEDMYDTAETVAKMGEKASNILEQVNNIQQGIFDALTDKNNHPKLNAHQEIISEYLKGERDLQDVLNNIGQLTDKEQEQLREWMGQLIDYNKELRKTQKEAYDKIIESIEEFNDKMERQQDIVNDTAGVMEHYANIIDIIGKDTLGISDAMMNALNDLQVTAAQSNLTIVLTALNENRDALAKIQKDLAEARKQQAETDDELRKRALENDIKYLEEAMEQQEDIVRDLAEEWASAYEDALKSAQDAFTNGVKLATEAFDKAVSGSIGSLDKLQDFYDKQTTLQDIFLPDYERIHDLSKLARDINNAINATDNIKGKERLRNLQNEILEAQREGTELSKYDMEFMQKRFELEQAQIAMEEQRNAKNLVRMTRDNEGNWSYTYTQNPEDMAKAQQEFEDKLYELEKLNQDRVKETQQLMLNAMEKFRDEIADADMNDQEKTQALLDYWRQLQEEYGNLTDTALKNGSWITDTYDVSNHELTDSFEETLLSLGTGYQTLEDFMNDFRSASATMGDDVAAQYQKWGDYVKAITEAAGINFDNFAQRVADDMDLVIAAMIGEDGNGGAVGVAKQLADEMGISVDDILKELEGWWNGPEGRSVLMEAEIEENEKTYEQLEKLIANADQIPIELPKISQAVAKIASGGNECGCGATCTTTCWTDCGSNGASAPRPSGCGSCSANCSSGCAWSCTEAAARFSTPDARYHQEKEFNPNARWATGGYTGAWGPEGKLAILDEKELVLNKEDTANMLATVGFVRDLVEMIGVNATSAGGIGNLLLGGVASGGNYLDQNVNIHAEFPNATNHSEIEEAFQNLIGLAGQYAGRKQ